MIIKNFNCTNECMEQLISHSNFLSPEAFFMF